MEYKLKPGPDGHPVLVTELIQACGGETYHLRPIADAEGVDMGDGTTLKDRFQILERTVAGNTTTRVVGDIAMRDALPSPIEGDRAIVLDASDDPTVTAGWAEYVFRGAADGWHKLAEGEGDDALFWDKVKGRPKASPDEIDYCVDHRSTAIVHVLDRVPPHLRPGGHLIRVMEDYPFANPADPDYVRPPMPGLPAEPGTFVHRGGVSLRNPLPASGYVHGDAYTVTEAGDYAGRTLHAGDLVFAVRTWNPATQSDADWAVLEVHA